MPLGAGDGGAAVIATVGMRDLHRAGALGALAAAALVGCEDPVLIQQMQLPTYAAGGCTVSSDPARGRLDRGVFDVALRTSYSARPLYRNPHSQAAIVHGVIVEIHEGSPEGPLVGQPFTAYQTVTLPSADVGAGFLAAETELVPPQIGAALRLAVCQSGPATADCPVALTASADRLLLIKLTAFGETVSGSEFETPPFMFPVRVCCGCLVTFPTEARAPDTVHRSPNCDQGAAAPGPANCAPGQDVSVDCRLCSTTNAFCQPPGYARDPSAPACAR